MYRSLCPLFVPVALCLVSGIAKGQESPRSDLRSNLSELLAFTSNDGRSHEIEAIAAGGRDTDKPLYVVESVQDVVPRGSVNWGDGEYVLWKIGKNGKVLHKESLGKRVRP